MAPMAQAPPPPAVVHAADHKTSDRHGSHRWKIYTVQPGDTWSALATRYDTTVSALRERNNSWDIKAGQHVAVPSGARPARSKAPATTEPKAKHRAAKKPVRHSTDYTVRPGDTLTSIAQAHHTTVAALMKANHLSGRTMVYVGHELRVPTRDTPDTHKNPSRQHEKRHEDSSTTSGHDRSGKGQGKKAESGGHTSYTVHAGDTLTSIAQDHDTTVDALVKANDLDGADLVRSGQSLRIPTQDHLTKAERTFAGRTYPEKVVREAATKRSYLADHPAPSRAEVKSLIIAAAHRYGVDPKLALAIAWQESGWNQRAVSVAGAVGVMQVMPSSGSWASDMSQGELDLMQARDNVRAGTVILRYLTSNADSLDQAIAGYYQGLHGVQNHGMLPDTKTYVRNVRAHMTRF